MAYATFSGRKIVRISDPVEPKKTKKEKKVKKSEAEKIYDDFIKSNPANEYAPGDWHAGAQAIMDWYLEREKKRANKKK